jgi:circadian clock protein KaiC
LVLSNNSKPIRPVFGNPAAAICNRISATRSEGTKIVDPLSALLSTGTLHQTQGMLLRLIDHLKTVGVTALFTTLQTVEEQSDLQVSSIMDTWIRVANVYDAAGLRRLHIVKSRGMAHSSQMRVMEIGKSGVRLVERPDADFGPQRNDRGAYDDR